MALGASCLSAQRSRLTSSRHACWQELIDSFVERAFENYKEQMAARAEHARFLYTPLPKAPPSASADGTANGAGGGLVYKRCAEEWPNRVQMSCSARHAGQMCPVGLREASPPDGAEERAAPRPCVWQPNRAQMSSSACHIGQVCRIGLQEHVAPKPFFQGFTMGQNS
jgi:hypothetical protein